MSVTDARRDGDVVRLRLRLDGVSPGSLRAAKRALVGHGDCRAFVRLGGRYTAWHSKKLYGMILGTPPEGVSG